MPIKLRYLIGNRATKRYQTMTIKIKTALIDDLEAVSKLFNHYRVFYQQPSDLALARSFIAERLTNQDSTIFFAHNGASEPLGFTQLYPSFSSVSAQRTWILNDLYVDKKARQKGVARQLMEAAKRFAIETNSNGISLETAFDNTTAQRLYESLGYRKNDSFFSYFLSMK